MIDAPVPAPVPGRDGHDLNGPPAALGDGLALAVENSNDGCANRTKTGDADPKRTCHGQELPVQIALLFTTAKVPCP